MSVLHIVLSMGSFISRLPVEHALMTAVQWPAYLTGHPLYGAPYALLALALLLGQMLWAVVFVRGVFFGSGTLSPVPVGGDPDGGLHQLVSVDEPPTQNILPFRRLLSEERTPNLVESQCACLDCGKAMTCGHWHFFCDVCATQRHGVPPIPCGRDRLACPVFLHVRPRQVA